MMASENDKPITLIDRHPAIPAADRWVGQDGGPAGSLFNQSRPMSPSGFDPWAWRPSSAIWFRQLEDRAASWQPSAELGLDPRPLIDSLLAAAEREQRWLLHPCVNPLTLSTKALRLQRDFQLVVWIAAHSPRSFFGKVNVPEPLWVWSPDGGWPIQAGVHHLEDLAFRVRRDTWPWAIALDTWNRSISSSEEQSWAALVPSTPAEEATLRWETTQFLRALDGAERNFRALHEWAIAMTQVVVPLRRPGTKYCKSRSSRRLPGVVFLTIHDEVQVLEALVHETAHNYLFLAEMAGPLVDPSHFSTYASPLRADPRPLLGVLLAYHALAYMCAFYADAVRYSPGASIRCEYGLESARSKLCDSETTLLANRRFLTENGRDFLRLTEQVAAFSIR